MSSEEETPASAPPVPELPEDYQASPGFGNPRDHVNGDDDDAGDHDDDDYGGDGSADDDVADEDDDDDAADVFPDDSRFRDEIRHGSSEF